MIQNWKLVVVVSFTLFAAACSSSTSNSNTGTNPNPSSTFTISGTLASTTVSKLSPRGLAVTGTVTHVMAVNPSSSNPERVVAEVAADGTFSLDVTTQNNWVLVFVDANQVGANMILGIFKASALDTLPVAATTGSTDLGTVSIDSSTSEATSGVDYATFLDSLGLTSVEADEIGALDDLCLRYVNPDIDGNGTIDALETNRNFGLDFHVRFTMLQGVTQVSVPDLVGNFLDETTTTSQYSSTGVYVSYPSSFSSETAGTTTFGNDVTLEGSVPAPANTPISSVTSLSNGSTYSFGPNLESTSELPSGTIVFNVGTSSLTFTNVKVPTLAELNAPTGRIFPFIRFNKNDGACTSACTLASVDYKWMKKTDTGWTPASVDELSLIVNDSGGFLSIYLNNDTNKRVTFTLPQTSASGTLTWDTTSASLEGAVASDLTSATTEMLCHVGLSYDDKLGMRYFENLNDGPDCP